MKRFLCLFLCALLVLALAPAACADLDLSVLEGNAYCVITPDESGSVTYINSTFSTDQLSFSLNDEREDVLAAAQLDILVIQSPERSIPVLRLSLYYAAQELPRISSATFTLGGQDYTFTGIADESPAEFDSGKMETALITFSLENIDFIIALESYCDEMLHGAEASESYTIPLVLHGAEENIETTLSVWFLFDFIVVKNAFLDIGGVEYMEIIPGTEMTVS